MAEEREFKERNLYCAGLRIGIGNQKVWVFRSTDECNSISLTSKKSYALFGRYTLETTDDFGVFRPATLRAQPGKTFRHNSVSVDLIEREHNRAKAHFAGRAAESKAKRLAKEHDVEAFGDLTLRQFKSQYINAGKGHKNTLLLALLNFID